MFRCRRFSQIFSRNKHEKRRDLKGLTMILKQWESESEAEITEDFFFFGGGTDWSFSSNKLVLICAFVQSKQELKCARERERERENYDVIFNMGKYKKLNWKKSDLPESNQRPKDGCGFSPTTVLRSTNWAKVGFVINSRNKIIVYNIKSLLSLNK